MMHYLLIEIPSLLFEPVAVGTVLGCFVALLFPRKKHKSFFVIITTTTVFMLSWRLIFYSLMASRRYASILLYFSIIMTVWFCFRLKELAQWANQALYYSKSSGTTTICSAIPFLLVIGLAVACIIKDMHYTPYGDYSVKLCRVFAKEIFGKDFLLFSQGEQERIAYYTGIDIRKVIYLDKDNLQAYEQINEKLNLLYNFVDYLYFIVYLNQEYPELDAQHLKIDPETGNWECLHREYTSRKKNKEFVLYRFIPAHPNIEVWNKDIPEVQSNNLCRNGDYEKVLSGKDLEQRLLFYKKNGASDYYFEPGRFFPIDWGLSIVNTSYKSSKVSLTAENPIAGKYSLELISEKNGGWGINSCFIPKQDCFFSGFIRAESEASVYIRSCSWDSSNNDAHYIKSYLFHLQPAKTYRFSFPINTTDIPENDKTIFVTFQGTGHVLFDNIEAIRNSH